MDENAKENNSIIYWKWENATLDSDLTAKIEDLCRRTEMNTICIGLHWIESPFQDAKLRNALELCCTELHKRGRKLIIEVCPRNEGDAFFQKYPEEVAYVTTATEITLNETGIGESVVDTSAIPHYWRTIQHKKPQLLAAHAVIKSSKHQFGQGSNHRVDNIVTLVPHSENSTIVRVNGGAEYGGYTVVAFVGIPQPIPDLASDYLIGLYDEMLSSLEGIKIDGVMSDEWGYDVVLCAEKDEETGNQKPALYFKHITYSDNFAQRYRSVSGGDLLEDLLYFYYIEEGLRERSVMKVNMYHATFRSIMRQNDDEMYTLTKQKLGMNAFYGVHPTWWGNNYLQNFEGFKNGFYWWEAKRDIAQTDEIVIMSIRTALAHKWGSHYWYNMWYSMGTRDIHSYYKETWQNVRFGGRTHYLAYECPNESVVLELKPDGLLESIEQMDSIVRSIDIYQKASPDCRVLLLFGMENALNWFYNDQAVPPWYSHHKIFTALLQCADIIFDSYLCDLVPTSEIVNGSVVVEGGKVRYGTQQYDAVVLLAPDALNKACFDFLLEVESSRLIVAGKAVEYDNGKELKQEDAAILERGVRLQELFSPKEIISILDHWNIAKNRFANGCVLQDGSMIFTAEGKHAVHNPLIVNEKYNNLLIDFVGEDLLYLHNTGEHYLPIYPAGKLSIS